MIRNWYNQIPNLFQNLNKTSEQILAEQAQCVEKSEALELTNKTDGSKYKQPYVELRMLKQDSPEDQIYAMYRTLWIRTMRN